MPNLTANRKLTALGLTALAAGSLALGTMFTGAIFTDTKSDSSTFTTGTIALDAAKIAAMDLTSANMMPGDTQVSAVTVQNNGTAQLRYAVSQTSTNADTKNLRSVLLVTVLTADTGAGSFANDGDYCDDANGATVYSSAALGASSNLVGDPTQGFQAGDRSLNGGGANEVLCFYVALPQATGNAFQGASTTTTFTFAAEQTANN
jgi:Camelysin metallo-endopeptidase